jgi:hypothetical protein
MIFLSLLIGANHHFHLCYATPNVPLLMIAWTIALTGWHRRGKGVGSFSETEIKER